MSPRVRVCVPGNRETWRGSPLPNSCRVRAARINHFYVFIARQIPCICETIKQITMYPIASRWRIVLKLNDLYRL